MLSYSDKKEQDLGPDIFLRSAQEQFIIRCFFSYIIYVTFLDNDIIFMIYYFWKHQCFPAYSIFLQLAYCIFFSKIQARIRDKSERGFLTPKLKYAESVNCLPPPFDAIIRQLSLSLSVVSVHFQVSLMKHFVCLALFCIFPILFQNNQDKGVLI